MAVILPSTFFARPAPEVAPDLLGKWLVRERNGERQACRIIETEAYEGGEDLACHAAKGRTARTEVMFGPPGRFYVYFVYGMHHMLNVVTNVEGRPSAVLIRGIESVSGPGRLTRALGITRQEHNQLRALPESGLWFEDRGFRVAPGEVLATPRIGVDYAGAHWAAMPWRFVWAAADKGRRSGP